jgi:hypothetical protein
MSHNKYGYDDHYGRHEYSRASRSGYPGQDIRQLIFGRIKSNPKLRILIVGGAILLLFLIILAVLLFLPLIIKLFNYVTENGLQGLIDSIWKGTGK